MQMHKIIDQRESNAGSFVRTPLRTFDSVESIEDSIEFGRGHSQALIGHRHDVVHGGRRVDLVGAGTFGAPVREWVPGYPLQYQLLQIEGQRMTVHTRRREEPNGAWKPDARWLQGAGKDPLPRYEIDL